MRHLHSLRSTRGRLLLLAVIVEAVMLSILVSNSLRLLTENMGEQARQHVGEMTPVIIAAIVAPLAQRDYATVQAILDESKSVGGIDYLAVTGRDGKKLAVSGWPLDAALPDPDRSLQIFGAGEARYDVAVPVAAYGQTLGRLHIGLNLSQIRKAHDQLFMQGVGIALLEILLSAALMALLGYYLTRHLGALTTASQLVAEGNLTPPPVPEGDDEIGRLGAAFNLMSRAVTDRISELTAARDEQARLAEAAASAAQAKATFLATMSHEIRTPMNGILGMTDLALTTGLTAEQREYLNWIKSSGDSLMRVLNDILDFSKIDAGQMTLESIPFSLRGLLDGLIAMHAVAAHQRGLALYREGGDHLPDAFLGDPVRLQQIFNNLLSNAIKFTERGEVVVRLSGEAEAGTGQRWRLVIAIADTGIGIAPDKLDSIFAPFTQAEDSTTRRFGGTGLGLSIVSRLVDLMQGQLTVDSIPGQGTTFSIALDLPLGGDLPLRHEEAGAPAPASDASLAGRRILLVEDTPVNQKLGQRLLARQGALVELAGDGEEALELLARESFDLVLMDIQMPRMDGYTATRLWREREQALSLPRKPVIALTANALAEDREHCLAAGMDDFIAKPFRADDMLAVLLRHL